MTPNPWRSIRGPALVAVGALGNLDPQLGFVALTFVGAGLAWYDAIADTRRDKAVTADLRALREKVERREGAAP